MPDRDTRTEKLQAGTPFTVGSATLLPIERIVIHTMRGKTHGWVSIVKEPYALAVRDAGGIRAVDTDAIAVSLEQLRVKFPQIDAVLASMWAVRVRQRQQCGCDSERPVSAKSRSWQGPFELR